MLNSRLKIWRKKEQPKTAIHPEYKKLIEKIATIDGRDLFAFKDLLDMPIKRHDKCMRFALEWNMHIDMETLQETHKEIIEDIGMMDCNNMKSLKRKIFALLDNLTRMTELTLSAEASYRLASCSYFWIDEDLTDYDFEIGDEKIDLFKKMSFDDFFLSEPMNKFLPRINLSAQDLQLFSLIEKERKKIHSEILTKTKLHKTTVS